MNTNEKPPYDILNRKLLQFSFHSALSLKSLQNASFNSGVGGGGGGGGGAGRGGGGLKQSQ